MQAASVRQVQTIRKIGMEGMVLLCTCSNNKPRGDTLSFLQPLSQPQRALSGCRLAEHDALCICLTFNLWGSIARQQTY